MTISAGKVPVCWLNIPGEKLLGKIPSKGSAAPLPPVHLRVRWALKSKKCEICEKIRTLNKTFEVHKRSKCGDEIGFVRFWVRFGLTGEAGNFDIFKFY